MTSSDFTKISVVTIVKNGGSVIESSIRSVVEQNYANIEYIIVDGGSTDGTLAVLARWSGAITRIISEPDRGISDAMNKGIRAATGELIGIVHSDDRLADGALALVADAYGRNGSPDIIHGNCIAFDAISRRRFLAKPDLAVRQPFLGQFMKHGSMFVRRTAYERFGAFDLTYKCAMDYDLVLRMYLGGARIVYVDAVIAEIRMYGISVRWSRQTRKESRAIAIAHGCPVWKANFYFAWKFGKWAALQMLTRARLQPVIATYRRLRGRAVPLN